MPPEAPEARREGGCTVLFEEACGLGDVIELGQLLACGLDKLDVTAKEAVSRARFTAMRWVATFTDEEWKLYPVQADQVVLFFQRCGLTTSSQMAWLNALELCFAGAHTIMLASENVPLAAENGKDAENYVAKMIATYQALVQHQSYRNTEEAMEDAWLCMFDFVRDTVREITEFTIGDGNALVRLKINAVVELHEQLTQINGGARAGAHWLDSRLDGASVLDHFAATLQKVELDDIATLGGKIDMAPL